MAASSTGMGGAGGIGGDVFNNGTWYHEVLEEGLAISYRVEKVLHRGTSKFQTVEVVKTKAFGSLLLTDGLMQSAQDDEYVYHQSLVHPAMAAHPCPKKVFIAGGGEGATLREVLKHPSVEEAMMVDIDGEVVEMCKEHTAFYSAGAYDDPRTKLIIGDAYAGLEACADGSIDVIIGDLCDPLEGGPCYQLYTTGFYEMCKAKLAPGGILITQSGCASTRDCHHVFTAIHHTLKQVFPQVWGYTVCVPSFTSEWGFNIATKEADAISVADGLHADGGLDKRLAERGLGELSYYDAITHTRMFSLNRIVRDKCRDETRVMTVENPLFMTASHTGVFEAEKK
eukprot:CAMPEP_0197580134 /NCGR_PEP_ID=MMETSP1326-20131121/3991_1 /TAXON_ID=1155430 /ORGANISM="Genus nov. species nov., Strain RCC2288" /LENGTH=339 /DNA_ID=CAMNT_0043143797 /DNA_START=90 /DNA_END=1109 /DNA_ORIENTATION=-